MTDLEFPLHYKAVGLDELSFEPLQLPGKPMTPREILEEHPTGIEYAHLVTEKAPILMDNKGTVLAFPPIINSENTKLTVDSTSLVIDVTGTDYNTAISSLNMLCANLIDRGAVVYPVTVVQTDGKEVVTPDLDNKEWDADPAYLNKRIGLDLKPKEIIHLLEKMRFGARVVGKKIKIIVPPYRIDIMHQVDFAEDMAIAYGYDKLIPEIPRIATLGNEKPIELFSRKIASLLTGLQALEVISYILTNRDENFAKMCLEKDHEPVAEISNPKTIRYRICRTWLLPCVLEILSRNTSYPYPQRVFEIGDTVIIDEKAETGARTARKLCLAETGLKTGFNSIKGVLGTIESALGLEFNLEPLDHPSLIPGRAGEIVMENDNGNSIKIGILGEVHPQVLLNWNMNVPVSMLELNMKTLMELF